MAGTTVAGVTWVRDEFFVTWASKSHSSDDGAWSSKTAHGDTAAKEVEAEIAAVWTKNQENIKEMRKFLKKFPLSKS